MIPYVNIIGRKVFITVDRPLGSFHPKYPSLVYPLNYGYVKEALGGDGQYQDVYLLGVDHPVASFTAVVIGVIHRLNDTEDKWVAPLEGRFFTKDDIQRLTHFQEQYFLTEIHC